MTLLPREGSGVRIGKSSHGGGCVYEKRQSGGGRSWEDRRGREEGKREDISAGQALRAKKANPTFLFPGSQVGSASPAVCPSHIRASLARSASLNWESDQIWEAGLSFGSRYNWDTQPWEKQRKATLGRDPGQGKRA
jgi:hypothetical protein